MANAARKKLSRRSWLLAGGALPLLRAPLAANATPTLRVSSDADNLHVAAPELHFLTGKPLARLRDGNTVVFLSQLTLFHEEAASGPRTIFRRAPERITVSYDVWEEKFQANLAVYRRIAGRMSLTDTEAWCLENLAISALGLAPQRPFWLRLELRTASERDLSAVAGETGISIRGLIEIFSRKAGAGEDRWQLEAGPLRLIDVPRMVVRRTRNG